MRDDLPLLLTARLIRERVLPIGRRTMARYLAAGSFPAPDLRLGGKAFWRRENIETWLEKNAAGGTPAANERTEDAHSISRV